MNTLVIKKNQDIEEYILKENNIWHIGLHGFYTMVNGQPEL